ncbi:MAG: ABC transporter ATP-binding protein [Peptostreptococcaceae bacterium]|nr:ABC transporter ATP-binding protein [Peptostreptococcaceae bacterium]
MSGSILECRALSKTYGREHALNSIDLSIEKGRIVGLLGPNGSGKTTLIKLANGLIVPTQGEILIDGEKPSVETKKKISYLPDRNYLDNDQTVESIIKLFRDFYDDLREEKALQMLDSLQIDPKKRMKTLSKGTKEKVQLILVMSRKADLYLLDEPIAGVDPAARDYIMDTIIRNYDEKSTILISTHLISDIEKVLDEAIFIHNGNIMLHKSIDDIREEHAMSVDEYFREVFR